MVIDPLADLLGRKNQRIDQYNSDVEELRARYEVGLLHGVDELSAEQLEDGLTAMRNLFQREVAAIDAEMKERASKLQSSWELPEWRKADDAK